MKSLCVRCLHFEDVDFDHHAICVCWLFPFLLSGHGIYDVRVKRFAGRSIGGIISVVPAPLHILSL